MTETTTNAMKPISQRVIAALRRVCALLRFTPPARVLPSNVCLPGRSAVLSIVLLHSAWFVLLTRNVVPAVKGFAFLRMHQVYQGKGSKVMLLKEYLKNHYLTGYQNNFPMPLR